MSAMNTPYLMSSSLFQWEVWWSYRYSGFLEISFDEGDGNRSQAEATKSRDLVKKVLLAVESRFPAELDKAITLQFQLLLPPIVSQLVVKAPAGVSMLKQEETADVPSLQERDDTLVSCLGQMVLTAGTVLLWKPLNHEVLMCTRVEKLGCWV